MDNKKMPVKPGFIFQELNGKSPATLTLKEINDIIYDDKVPEVVFFGSSLFPPTGNIFQIKDYDIDAILDNGIKGL